MMAHVSVPNDAAYWWTHTALGEEALPPVVTAAEETIASLAAVEKVAQERVVTCSAAFIALALAPEPSETDRNGICQALEWADQLEPHLQMIRKAMEREWRESHGGGGAAKESAQVIQDRRQKLSVVQQRIYTLFLKAILQGVVEGLRRVFEAVAPSPPSTEASINVCLQVCMDGLVLEICGRSEMSGNTHPRWRGGLISSLEAEETDTHASRLHKREMITLWSAVYSFLYDDLRITPMEQVCHFPLLTERSRTDTLALIASVRERGVGLCHSGTPTSAEPMLSYLRLSVTFFRWLVRGLQQCDQYLTQNEAEDLFGTNHTGMDKMLSHLPLCPVALGPITTYEGASQLVSELTGWYAVCRDVYALLHRLHRDESEKGLCTASQECSGTLESPRAAVREAETLLTDIRRHAFGVSLVLDQFHSTSVLLVPYIHIIASTLLPIGECHSFDSNQVPRETLLMEGVCHEDIKVCLLEWANVIQDTANDQRNQRQRLSEGYTFREACLARCLVTFSVDVLRSKSDLEGSTNPLLSDDHIIPLSFSLVQQPLSVLSRLLDLVLPVQKTSSQCNVEGIVSETGKDSQRRSRAFEERTQHFDTVAMIYFTPYFCLFSAIEKALQYLAGRLAEEATRAKKSEDVVASPPLTTNLSVQMELFLAASLDEAFQSILRENRDVAASELVMFFYFMSSSLMPSDETCLTTVRGAVRRFFNASPAAPFKYLHRLIVDRRHYGLAAFFLPPLRALGVDFAVAQDVEHLSVAVGHPASAEAMYFYELPRGYFNRSPQNLALRGAEDAINWFAQLLPSSKDEDNVQEAEALECFIGIVVEAGRVTLSRLSSELQLGSTSIVSSSSNAILNPANARETPRGGSSGDLPQSLSCAKAVTYDIMASLFYGVLRLCTQVSPLEYTARQCLLQRIVYEVAKTLRCDGCVRMVAPVSFLLNRGSAVMSGNEQPSVDAATVDSIKGDDDIPHHWEDWLWSVEYADLDDYPYSCVKSTILECNRDYMRHLPTKTLLGLRSSIEKKGEKQKANTNSVVQSMRDALQFDFAKLRERARLREEQKQAPKEQTASHSDTGMTSEDHPLEPAASDPVAPVVESSPIISSSTSEPLKLAQVRDYMERVFVVLIQRGRMSPVDGAAAGVALQKFIVCSAGALDSRALVDCLRRLTYLVTTRLSSCTRLECTSLAVLLHEMATKIILPYRQSFLPGDVTCEFRDALPNVEKEAASLLQSFISDAAVCTRTLLSKGTLLGDWCAYTVTHHCRHVLRLLVKSNEVFKKAVAARQLALKHAHAVSPGFQRLLEVDRPLLKGMSAPATDALRLFTPSDGPSMRAIVPSQKGQCPTTEKKTAEGRSGRAADRVSTERKRRRSHDRSYPRSGGGARIRELRY